MSRTTKALFTGTTALALAACADFMTSGSTDVLVLEPVFQTVPLGFSANTNSFDASADAGVAFLPGAMDATGVSFLGAGGGEGQPPKAHDDNRGTGEKRDGFGGPGLRGLLMGGGLGPDFLGRIPFGKGLGRGPFAYFRLPDTCVFDAESGRVNCPDKVHGVLTVTSSFQFKDTADVVQPKYDTASTDLVNMQVTVKGTKVRHRRDDEADKDSATTTVDHASDRTVSGLAPGSEERTINGTAHASEVTEGIKDSVGFKAERLATDSTRGLVIPISDGRPTIPTAGVIVRTMSVTITPAGGTPRSRTRREEITFDGSNVVTIVITVNDKTWNCTLTLPAKKLVCSAA